MPSPRDQIHRPGKSLAVILCALIVIGLFNGLARAQSAYSQEKLETFANAVIEVQLIAERWLPRINKAESDAAAQQMNKQAEAEVTSAIEAMPGITVAEYLEINTKATKDAILAKRINDILRQKLRK